MSKNPLVNKWHHEHLAGIEYSLVEVFELNIFIDLWLL
jgi:hypothetical protein